MSSVDHPTGVGSAWSPHCDAAVLHAPNECDYCDLYPAWQRYRVVAGIAFTGHEPLDDETMCPSEVRRPVETIERWGGNRPSKDE